MSDEGLAAVSALAEPTRRALYEHIAAAGGWVSREQAADSVGLERGTAAHHLDRLAADGLLEVDYQRLSGRQGPGAGRPAKLYRRAQREFGVALPPRDYTLAGRLLAQAVDRSRSEGTDINSAVRDVTRAEGRQLGDEISRAVTQHRRANVREPGHAVLDALEQHGFEPHTDENGTVVLRNCPFHQLAQQHTDLICGMNLCLMTAAIETVGDTDLEARLEPEEGQCCVKLTPAAHA